MTTGTQGNPLVRCGFCPGASAAVQRVGRTPCKSCVARVALDTPPQCPDCGGVLTLDTAAETATDIPPYRRQAIVAFCGGCEFAIEVTHE